MSGKVKIIVDVPEEVKNKLKDLAHNNRTSMTEEMTKLILEADKKAKRK